MQQPEVAAAIGAADADRQERLGFTADRLALRLWDIHVRAFEGSPKVTRDGKVIEVDGVPLVDWSPTGATRPIELLMKHLGMFAAERVEISGAEGMPVVYTLTLDRELPELDDDDRPLLASAF